MIFTLFDVHWVMNSLMKGLFLSWGRSFVGRKRKKAWKVAHLCNFLDHLEGKKYESH